MSSVGAALPGTRRRPPAAAPGAPSAAGTGPSDRVVRSRTVVFLGFMAVLLAVGMLGLLGLNTLLAQDSFTAATLQTQAASLAQSQQMLSQELAVLQAPASLAARAQALGMVPDTVPVFLHVPSGRVVGVSVPAAAPVPVRTAPVVVRAVRRTTKPAAKAAATKPATHAHAAGKAHR